MSIRITSPAFSEGGNIPRKFTFDGQDVSPALAWEGVPPGCKCLALIVDDPDAPAGTWDHWLLYNLPPDVPGLPEGITGVGTAGRNSWGRSRYNGPCPPRGKPHRYYFKLYALDTTLNLGPGLTKRELESAMGSHILAQGLLMGVYGR